MATLDQLRNIDNLRRAWRWIQSNADASYKSYFRSLYQHYAVAEEALLADLASRLKRGIYEPDVATKLYFPKVSGVLRPYSLLSVEDQIVYQAAVNLIAEKLAPKVRLRQLKAVFGHLYAGKTSTWFYRKWSSGYAAFNEATRKAVDDGLVYTASFDLTACYDSLDHGVLCHFLRKLGFESGFCDKLTEWLEKWTATSQGIFHHHGIPQGPLSSGLLSEVVLSYFDDLKVKGAEFRYLRYVDDIRLFARNEHVLRRLLVTLDHKSKDIGLFPQSSKISIHRVTDIEKELKSVSNPPEPAINRKLVDQKRLLARIGELTPHYRIEDQTRFKYLLAHANPSASLTARLWQILERHPEVYRNVCGYLRRYKKLPRVAAEKAVSVIKANSLYPSVKAEFIAAVDGRLPSTQEEDLAIHLKDGLINHRLMLSARI
ncbi:MAG TPA: RNA-directed DNA polymerase [Rhodanobacter sp.]|nr:RNA-directed DNA polymerase [Rhodanobacter sp.]